MSQLAQDLRLALRMVARQPGFAAVAVVTLALGIGATTTVFSLVYGIAWQPLPFEQPERIVRLWPEGRYTKEQFLWIQEESRSYESLMGWYPRGYVVREDEHAVILDGPAVTADFFDVLRGRAALGRPLREGDDRRGSDGIVISHRLWQSRFGGDPTAIGAALVVDDARRTIVGVMPETFDFLQRSADVAVPTYMDAEESDFTGWTILRAVGRLAPGVTTAEAQAELRALMAAWREERGQPADWGADATVVPLRESIVGAMRPTLRLLLGGVGLLLLIAAVNVSNLLLGRALKRLPEISLRAALGASSGRLVRLFLTESTLFALAGGLLGFLLTLFGLRGIVSILPSDTPRLDQVQPSLEVLGFAILVALATGWLAGLVPALQSRRASVQLGSGKPTPSAGRRRLRSALVVTQVALAVGLLIGAGHLVESLRRILAEDPGIETRGLMVLHLGSERGFVETPAEAQAYYERMRERLLAVPGIESVATVLRAPFYDGGWSLGVYPTGRSPAEGVTPPLAYWRPVDPEYFETAGIRLLEGRGFDRRLDLEDSEPVVILTKTTARALFPEGGAVGRKVSFAYDTPLDLTVAGVVGDVKLDGLTRPAPFVVYRPFSQALVTLLQEMDAWWRMIVLRTSLPPDAQLYGPVLDAVRDVDTSAPIHRFLPLGDVIGDSLAYNRVTTMALALSALTALLLGAIGLYGVMSYTVSQQLREMGIRVALGASSRRMLGGVLASALEISGLGILAGSLLALGLNRFLASLVFGISTAEPSVFVTVAVVLVAAALLATLIPARRAGRVDPIQVLKEE
jgi:predicted permease